MIMSWNRTINQYIPIYHWKSSVLLGVVVYGYVQQLLWGVILPIDENI